MKEGTLLKSKDYNDIGVAYKVTEVAVHVRWSRTKKDERIYFMDLNKFIAGGYIEVLETKEKSNE